MSALPREPGVSAGSRPVRVGAGPTVSLVVASSGKRAVLNAALRELVRACERLRVELVVARAVEADDLNTLDAVYPGVRWAAAPPGSTPAELRIAGMKVATGDLVVFTEDEFVSPESLLRQIGIPPSHTNPTRSP